MSIRLLFIFLWCFIVISCASNNPNNELVEARNKFSYVSQIDGVYNSSANYMHQSENALNIAEKKYKQGEKKNIIDHYSLLSIKNSEIAHEKLLLDKINKDIDNIAQERQKVILVSRNRDLTQHNNKNVEDKNKTLLKVMDEIDNIKANESDKGIVLTLNNVIFAHNSSKLEPGGRRTISRIAEFLKKNPQQYIKIEGYTDSTGDQEYNLDLSRRRAEAVREVLLSRNVSAERVSVEAFGEKYPVASNEVPSGRQQNRRVELIISNTDGQNVTDLY